MYLLTDIKNKISNRFNLFRQIRKLGNDLIKVQEALGRIESRQIQDLNGKLKQNSIPTSIEKSEFRVFSQWGEDGIIQALVRSIEIERKIFIEFGVQDYTESNTRFLLVNNNWSGLVIDGSLKNINYIKQDKIYWQHNLKAEYAFIGSSGFGVYNV